MNLQVENVDILMHYYYSCTFVNMMINLKIKRIQIGFWRYFRKD
jgi:hypothetical protein